MDLNRQRQFLYFLKPGTAETRGAYARSAGSQKKGAKVIRPTTTWDFIRAFEPLLLPPHLFVKRVILTREEAGLSDQGDVSSVEKP